MSTHELRARPSRAGHSASAALAGLLASAASGALATLAARIGSAPRRLVLAWQRAWATSELERLDDAALRDLGISRAEIGSIDAEARGEAERSRRRLADPAPGRPS